MKRILPVIALCALALASTAEAKKTKTPRPVQP